MSAPVSPFMPDATTLTEHERAWVGFIRLASRDTDPIPTLAYVQTLRRMFDGLDVPDVD